MNQFRRDSMQLIYKGSVKNLWAQSDGDGRGGGPLEFEYTDQYSVFDWGRMPDDLMGKGQALATIGAYYFEQMAQASRWQQVIDSPRARALLAFYKGRSSLGVGDGFAAVVEAESQHLAQHGLTHHYLGQPEPHRLRVQRVDVVRPLERRLGGQSFFDYKTSMGEGDDRQQRRRHDAPVGDKRLIPLEVVFRWGMPAGSSLQERLGTGGYGAQLGLSPAVAPGQWFEAPVVEFFTKLEPKDRFLTLEQAFHYSGLSWAGFQSLVARTLWVSCFLSLDLESKGLKLWDGKLEWAWDRGQRGSDQIILVDSIGPDELRLEDSRWGQPLSKEFLRQYYRRTPWYGVLAAAKLKAQAQGQSQWKELVASHLPPPLEGPVRVVAQTLYATLAQTMTGRTMAGATSLDELAQRLKACQASEQSP